MSVHANAIQALGSLPFLVRSMAMLAGGALRASLDGTPVKDYDLFFRSELDFQDCVALLDDMPLEYKRLPDAGRTAVYRQIGSGREFNLIGFAYGTAHETIERFDFRCCRMAVYLVCDVPQYVCDPLAETDCRQRRLVVLLNNGTERTLRRVAKYVDEYGYTLAATFEQDLATYLNTLPTCSSGGY